MTGHYWDSENIRNSRRQIWEITIPNCTRITEEGKETAHRLLEAVPPSELGYSLGEASIILYAYKKLLEAEIEQLEDTAEQFENTLETKRDTLRKTEDLMKTYYDASLLAREWEGTSEEQNTDEAADIQ